MFGNYKLNDAKHSGYVITKYTNWFKIAEISTLCRVYL
jgi:hypothetical protein